MYILPRAEPEELYIATVYTRAVHIPCTVKTMRQLSCTIDRVRLSLGARMSILVALSPGPPSARNSFFYSFDLSHSTVVLCI